MAATLTAAKFNWTSIPHPAQQMIVGIVLKERSDLGKCRNH